MHFRNTAPVLELLPEAAKAALHPPRTNFVLKTRWGRNRFIFTLKRTWTTPSRTIGGKDSIIIGGSQIEKIGSNAELKVGGNRTEKIGGNVDLDIGGNQTEKIGSNLSIDIGMNHNHKVGMSYGVDSGQTVYIKGGMNVVIESGLELTLTAAGGFINIGPAGVAISGTLVLINSGGAAGTGTPVQTTNPATPQAPDQADDGTKGTKM
jgi:type VI secretion system secreted protein VgrG